MHNAAWWIARLSRRARVETFPRLFCVQSGWLSLAIRLLFFPRHNSKSRIPSECAPFFFPPRRWFSRKKTWIKKYCFCFCLLLFSPPLLPSLTNIVVVVLLPLSSFICINIFFFLSSFPLSLSLSTPFPSAVCWMYWSIRFHCGRHVLPARAQVDGGSVVFAIVKYQVHIVYAASVSPVWSKPKDVYQTTISNEVSSCSSTISSRTVTTHGILYAHWRQLEAEEKLDPIWPVSFVIVFLVVVSVVVVDVDVQIRLVSLLRISNRPTRARLFFPALNRTSRRLHQSSESIVFGAPIYCVCWR